MLRRKPTAIAITSEDIAAFEEARLRKLSEENKHPEAHANGSSNVNLDPSDELKPLPGDKARIVRTREERIGITSGRMIIECGAFQATDDHDHDMGFPSANIYLYASVSHHFAYGDPLTRTLIQY
ncbi:unnamed protein product [Penicillium viridicatum]